MSRSGLPEYIEYLLQSTSYEEPVGQIELLQTHISFIILTDRLVYKWKKNVDLGFLDFSTLEKRKHFCDEELRLNRRLCPDIYLDRVHVSRSEKGFLLNGPADQSIEYGIRMTRLPQHRMMGEVIARGELRRDDLQAIVDILAKFYAETVHYRGEERFGSREAVRKSVYDNLEHIRSFVGGETIGEGQFRYITDYVNRFLKNEALFIERKKGGFVRDCHGDLHSGNICLSEDIQIFDCIEFNEDLRITDVAADVAFLAMDLDFHDLGSLSEYFVKRFIEVTGDAQLMKLLNFYKCYRAAVRGKIGLLTSEDPAVEAADRKRARKSSTRYFTLAERYCES